MELERGLGAYGSVCSRTGTTRCWESSLRALSKYVKDKGTPNTGSQRTVSKRGSEDKAVKRCEVKETSAFCSPSGHFFKGWRRLSFCSWEWGDGTYATPSAPDGGCMVSAAGPPLRPPPSVCCCLKQDMTSRGLFSFLPPPDAHPAWICLPGREGKERKIKARGGNCFPPLSGPSPSPGHGRIYFSMFLPPNPPFPLTQLLQLTTAGHTGSPPAARALPPSQTNSGWRPEAIKQSQQGPPHIQTSLRMLVPLSLC